MIQRASMYSTCRARKLLWGGLVAALMLVNVLGPTKLMAACNVAPTVGSIVGLVSAVRLSYGSTGNNCTGTLIFSPAPTSSPNGTQGTNYLVGQTFAGGLVVANNTAGTAGTVTLENGANQVIVPGTSVNFGLYFYKGTDFGGLLSITGAATAGGGTNPLWTYQTGAASLGAPALVAGGEVVASGNDGRVHSMAPDYGARQYAPGTSAGMLGYIGSAVQSRFPVIPGAYLASSTQQLGGCGVSGCDVAYAGAADGTVWAFNVRTGAKLWQSPTLAGPIQGAPAVQLKAFSTNFPWPSDLVIVGTRAATSTANRVYGLDGTTGAILWTFAPSNLDIINSTPALDYSNNRVWFTSYAGTAGNQPSIWALDTTSGALWASIALSTTTKNITSSPTLNFNAANPYLYVVTNGGDLVAVNTGTKMVTTVSLGGTGVTRAVVIPGTNSDDVYFSTSTSVNKQTFTFATQQFTQAWRVAGTWSNGDAVSSPSAPNVNGFPTPTSVYVGASNGKLYSLNPASGTVRDTRLVGTSTTIVGDPSFDGILNNIYVGASDGHIYSYSSF